MPHVVAATWRTKPGEESEVRRLLGLIAPLVRSEPACRMFVAHDDPDDPRTFFLYEQYDDEAGFRAHLETDHFDQLVKGEVVPRLELRERAFYRTME